MKTLGIVTISFFATLSLWFLGKPYLNVVDPYVQAATEAICCDIDVVLEGNVAVSESDVTRLLPMERSILWWMFHTEDIRARLSHHPFIEAAELLSSGVFPWGTFVIKLKERDPAYLALLPDKKLWLVSDKGELVRLFSDSRLSIESLPLVKGLVPSRHVDERKVLRRALYVQQFLAHAAESLSTPVRGVTLFGNGDLRVHFERVPFPVTFGSIEANPERVSVELVRFQKILDTLEDKEAVESLDLAFEQTAVIKRKKSPENSPS